MSLVLDASAALGWIYKQTSVPELEVLAAYLERQKVFVPQLWRLEVANVLVTNTRRKKHDMQFVRESLADFAQYRIFVDAETDAHVWHRTLDLTLEHALTSYDACYLELAIRLDLPLATHDKLLQTAASKERVSLLWA